MNKDGQDGKSGPVGPEETLHPWIEPELEARLTALVLGEASDFEREELERLVAERPELGLYRARLETVHGMLSDLAAEELGEHRAKQAEPGAPGAWRLAPERRAAVLARIGGGEAGDDAAAAATAGGGSGAEAPGAERRPPARTGTPRWRPLLQFAAALMLVGIVVAVMFPASVGRRSPDAGAWSFRLAEGEAADGTVSEDPAVWSETGLELADGAIPALVEGAAPAIRAGGDLALRRDPDMPGRITVEAGGEAALPERRPARPASPSDALFPRSESLAVAAGPEGAALAEGLETRSAESGERGLIASTGGGLSLSGTQGGMVYDDHAHHQTRSRMLRERAEGWESPPAAPSEPADSQLSAPYLNPPDEGNAHSHSSRMGRGQVPPIGEAREHVAIGHGGTRDAIRRREEKLKSIILPNVDFADTPLRDALEFLRQRSVELDTAEPDPSRRGINIVLDAGMMGGSAPAPAAPVADAGDGFGFSGGGGDVGDTRVTLRLSNVPLAEALRYTTSLAQLKYKVEPHAVSVVPLSTPDSDLHTNVYSVPPTFLAATEGGAGGGGAADSFADPFADPVRAGGGIQGRRRTAKDILESAGITFPPGSSVIYNPATSQLIVRTTPEQMELVEAYIEPIGSGEPAGDSERTSGVDPGAERVDASSVRSRSMVAAERSAGSGPATGQEAEAWNATASVRVPETTTRFESFSSIGEVQSFRVEDAETSRLGLEIDLAQSPEVVEVDGFINYSERFLTQAPSNLGEESTVSSSLDVPNRRLFPSTDDITAGPVESGDSSVQDILALTPQLGQASVPAEMTDRLSSVVPRIVGGGSAEGTRLSERTSAVSTIAAHFPSIDDIRPLPPTLAETLASDEPFSTFSLHVGDVSFRLARTELAAGRWPEAERIRIEEFVNALDYGDPMPATGEPVACRIDQAAHPFLQQRDLLRIAMRTAEAGRAGDVPLRLTVLLDTSGSMERPDRSATVRQAFATLAGLLRESDRVTLIGFARRPRLVADALPGDRAAGLAETVATLPSEGGTNLEAALQLGFEKAREHWLDGAQNRLVLLTDGAANLGDADAESLGALVADMREAGLSFDAAGIGAEGLNDEILEALARRGDGRYYLLDRPEDAGEDFAERLAGALRPAAENVKVQVEFNPGRVGAYRLLGYDKHRLETEDFRDDRVGAAGMAAAEAGVAVYQVEARADGEGDLGSVSVRFRDVESGRMVERRWPIPYQPAAPRPEQAGPAIQLATLASQFAAKLAGGPLGDLVDLAELARLAAALPEADRQSERVRELIEMIGQARALAGEG